MPKRQRPTVAQTAPPEDPGALRSFATELKRRDKRNAARRKRYKTDPKYRRSCIRRSKGWMKRTGRGAKAEGDGWKDVLVASASSSETKRLRVGTTVTLAVELKRGKDAIASWERSGILPEPAFRTPKGWRLYTEDQVAAVADAYKTSGMTSRSRGRNCRELILFRALVSERWARLKEGFGDWQLAGEDDAGS